MKLPPKQWPKMNVALPSNSKKTKNYLPADSEVPFDNFIIVSLTKGGVYIQLSWIIVR